MSINTFAKIIETTKSFKLTVHNADTGEPVWEEFSFSSLKEAVAKFRAINQEGELEYGLQDVKLKTDIVKGKKDEKEK